MTADQNTKSGQDTIPDIAQKYAQAFAALQPDNIDDLLALLSDDVRFADPFNDVTGKTGFRAIFEHMFATCKDPQFHIIDIATSATTPSERVYLRWRMSGRLATWPGTTLALEGMSEIHIADNMVTAHFDHWDSASQLLAKLPLIRSLLRPILSLFSVRTGGS